LRGTTESLVTTRGPDGSWNVAALGLDASEGEVTARTWGATRTRQNFERVVAASDDAAPAGVVQFTTDPVHFARGAMERWERDAPVLSSAAAWIVVAVEQLDSGSEHGTEWVDWRLSPREWAVREERVPTTNRGSSAVVEATVAASRLGVAGYDQERLRARLAYFAQVARRCGGDREQAAIERTLAAAGIDPDDLASANEPF
jgi:hypothetical protein